MKTVCALICGYVAVVGSEAPAAGSVPGFPDATVISASERPVRGTDRRERVVLARTELKYPLVRTASLYGADGRQQPVAMKTRAMVGDHIIVRAADGVSEAAIASLSKKHGGTIRKRLHAKGFYLVAFRNAGTRTVPDALAAFRAADSLVNYAEPDSIGQLHATTPDDPYFVNGHLWGHERIRMPEAWTAHRGSTNTVVAVIDTGIDYDHPDLEQNVWVNPGESGVDGFGTDRATNGIDDDANGFVDDVRGWDFYNDDNDASDGHSHGTRCAGHIGAVGSNGVGVVGVCWNVGILPLKMWSDSGQATLSDAIEAFAYVAGMRTQGINVRVISVSWGLDEEEDGEPEGLREVLQACGDAGILCTASAGNDNVDIDATPRYPACYDLSNVLTVAATAADDTKSGTSSYGVTNVDLAAPGVNIWSTALNGGYAISSGTSRSSPYVAGVAGLLWDLHPQRGLDKIRAAILQGTDPVPALAGITATGGRLNALGAMLQLGPSIRHNPLVNTTNTLAPYVIDADVQPVSLVDTNQLLVIWEPMGSSNALETNYLQRISNHSFQGAIPPHPLGTEIRYYLRGQTTNGTTTTAPRDVPSDRYRFHVVEPVPLTVTGTPSLVGTPLPDYGAHLFPSGVTVFAEAPGTSPVSELARYACAGWSRTGGSPGSGSSNRCGFVIGTTATLAWQWQLQYGLRQTASPVGIVATTNWCAADGETSSVRAPPRATLAGTNYHLAGWFLDGLRTPDATNATPNPIAGILMSTSRQAVAVYMEDNRDEDGDTLPDWWEFYFFGGTNDAPADDADHDGFTNLEEFADSTDPRDRASTPVPPVIVHTPLASPQVFGPPYEISAVITDNTAVAVATLAWQRVGGVLSETGLAYDGERYHTILPGPGGDGDAFEYSIAAWDEAGHLQSGAAHNVTVRLPRLALSAPGRDTFVLGFESVTGLSYGLSERSMLGATGGWSPVEGGSNLAGTGDTMAYTGTTYGAEGRFYRLRVSRP
jgi:hypothetical protein